jgi:hypothetical protein
MIDFFLQYYEKRKLISCWDVLLRLLVITHENKIKHQCLSSWARLSGRFVGDGAGTVPRLKKLRAQFIFSFSAFPSGPVLPAKQQPDRFVVGIFVVAAPGPNSSEKRHDTWKQDIA